MENLYIMMHIEKLKRIGMKIGFKRKKLNIKKKLHFPVGQFILDIGEKME